MAFRKPSKSSPAKSSTPKSMPAKAAPAAVTPVRNSAVPPKAAAPMRKATIVTREAIAIRAFEIWKSGKGGSSEQNWSQAERELGGL
jgi:hypothetical protein